MKIIVVEPGSLKPETASLLEKKGVVVIEHKDPEKVRVLNFESKIFTHDLLMSALLDITENNNGGKFTKELRRRLLEKEENKKLQKTNP